MPGSPTRKQARGRAWRRCGANLFVPAEVDSTAAAQRIVESAYAAPCAAVTGWAALHWLGARWFPGVDARGCLLPVPLAIGDVRKLAPRQGAVLSEDWLFADDIVVIDGLPITVPERSVSYEARRARSLPEAVRIIDMAAYDDLIDLAALTAYIVRLPARPGIRLLRAAVGMADENAWSPMEPDMRIVWELEGRHPRPLCNVPIFDPRGTHLFTPDLFDPVAGVAGEYNGGVHDADEPRARDLAKEELARSVGIEMVTMMKHDRHASGPFHRRLRSAYARSAVRGDAPRLWTIEQPEWWVDTSTVSARRGLADAERARWLSWRRP
ncbi:hypothetical protein [Nocardioides montaniterrae]